LYQKPRAYIDTLLVMLLTKKTVGAFDRVRTSTRPYTSQFC